MSWTVTLISAAATLAVTLFCAWRGAAAPDFSRGPRLFPYRLVMLLGAAVLALLAVHMGGLAGMLPPSPTYGPAHFSG